MDIEYYGANCLALSTKKVRVVVDDNLAGLGATSVTKPGDVAVFTGPHGTAQPDAKLTIDMPGEYEVAAVSVYGIPARAHLEETAVKNSTMYKIVFGDLRILVTGHVYPELSEAQLEAIGSVDVVCVPVGGNGYTLDPTGALQLIRNIEPNAVIVTHYADKDLNYEVPQQELSEVLKILSMEPTVTTKKLKLKNGDFAEGTTDLIILEKS